MIILKNINKTYYSKSGKVNALKDINLVLPDKGMVFVVGKSGCGKTTLLNILGGLDKFDSGTFEWNEKSTAKFTARDWDNYRTSHVGFVFQENNLLEEYNVDENVRIALQLQGAEDESKNIQNYLSIVGLSGFEKRKIQELSGGQKQRVTLARALAKKSRMLLADEPTGSLDETTSNEIFSLLKLFSQRQLVVVVTHDMDAAQKYADNIIFMADGHIRSETSKTEHQLAKTVVSPSSQHKRLSAKSSTSLATKAFKKTPIRFFVLVILCVFAFSLMVGALKFAFWQPYDLQQQVLSSENYAKITKSSTISASGGVAHETERFFSVDDLQAFKAKYKNNKIYGVTASSQLRYRLYEQLTERQDFYFDVRIIGKMHLSQDDMRLFGIELLAGEYPNSKWDSEDIAISKLLFEAYSIGGYSYDGTDFTQINSPTDLIGKKINEFTIRGVVDTNFDREEYKDIKGYALGMHDDFSRTRISSFSDYFSAGLHNVYYFSPDIEATEDSYYLFVPFNALAFEADNFVRSVFDDPDLLFVDYYSRILNYQVESSKIFGNTMAIVAGVFIAFALILFTNFITISINDKLRQIGILRAMGASRSDIARIFIIQNLIVATVVFIAAAFAVYLLIMPVLVLIGTTHTLPFPWYTTVFTDYLLLFVFIVLSAIVASLMPLIKLSRKTPREIIAKS